MKRKILLIGLCIFFLCIAGFYGIQFFREMQEYRLGEKMYEDLSQYAHLQTFSEDEHDASSRDTHDDTTSENKDLIQWPEVDFKSLQMINPDIKAWIYIEGTNINYPVVQGTDNSYYLDHLFDGNINSAGSIFIDYRNSDDLTDKNTILYGHHMQNNTMFSQITKYKEQSFYDQHPSCLIMTPDKNYTMDFIAGYVIDMNSDAWQIEFASDEEFASWLENSISLSTFTSTVKPTEQDRVVTFSTCTYEYNDARYVLIGVLNENI